MMETYNPDWYAAFVKTGEEDDVKARLEYRFKDCLRFFFPKRKMRERKDGLWHDVLRPMFPGYILINGAIGPEEYYNFKNVPGLWKLLSSGEDLISIPKREIELIKGLMRHGEIVGPSSLLEEGGHVSVVDGPLIGMEGNILKIDRRKGRAKVTLTFLSETRIVDLSINLLQKI